MNATAPAPETLNGTIQRIAFENPENGYYILQVDAEGELGHVSVVGTGANLDVGHEIQAIGRWGKHPKYGLQFRADVIAIRPPSTEEGLRRYLASGMVEGIGKTYAERLVGHFGTETIRVIEEEPARLRSVPGIGPKRAEAIREAWDQHRGVHRIMMFLLEHDASPAQAARIYRQYGDGAIARIQADPYSLARDIHGIGFTTADRIASRCGIPRDSLPRLRAGLSHALEEAKSRGGHCGLPTEELIRSTCELLSAPMLAIDPAPVRDALAAELEAGRLIEDQVEGQSLCFLAGLYRTEQKIAQRLETLLIGEPTWEISDVEGAIERAEAKSGKTLSASQREALRIMLAHRVSVLTGGPGTGKTTTLNTFLHVLDECEVDYMLAAPTGTAAKRMTQATGRPAQTMHRLIGLRPGEVAFDEGAPLETDCVGLDEQSMTDVPLFLHLLNALPDEAALFLIGDPDQLGSVGPGRVLLDLIESGRVPVARLTEIHRQAAESRIVTNAHRINSGQMPDLGNVEGTDFFFVSARDADDAAAKIISLVTERLPRAFEVDPLRDIQVLAPMHRGSAGTIALNLALQEALNPDRGQPSLSRFGRVYRAGDKVLQLKNNYETDTMNGSVGYAVSVAADGSRLVAEFDHGSAEYDKDDLDELGHAFACSIHKAQGSEAPVIVVPVTTQAYPMLERNLLYTAVTRATRLVVLVGQKRAVQIAVETVRSRSRNTMLKAFLSRSDLPVHRAAMSV